MINFLDLKDTLQSIIKNKEVLQTDVLSLDALRAMVQLRNTSEIEVGSGVKEPGNYLNEIAEGAEGFASSEVNIVLNDELFFWGNDGNPMEYVSTRDRFLRPRGMGGENGDGGYTGIGTRTVVAKHGLPYYFLSIEDLKYYVRCVRIPNIPDTFDAEQIGKKVTEWHLDEYQISQEEYMTLASFSKEDNIWTSKYFNEVPTMMCVVRLWDDFENLLPKKSYNVDKIMQESIAGKSIKNQLEKIYNKDLEKFKKNDEILKKKEKKIIAQKNIMSQEDFQKELTSLRSEIINFQREQVKSRDNINKLRIGATNKLISKLSPILKEYAKENSISLILQKKNIIMGKKELDITDDVLKIVDEKITKIKFD